MGSWVIQSVLLTLPTSLTYLHVQTLNQSLQDDVIVTDAIDQLKIFQMKLRLSVARIKKGTFDMFEALAVRHGTCSADQMIDLKVSLQSEQGTFRHV